MNKIDILQKEMAKAGYLIKKASDISAETKQRTGIFALDYVLDGGISMCEGGHRIELFGAESSGKTTLALYIIKKWQEMNKLCVFIDAEKSYDKKWATQLGVDNKKLLIEYPDSLEQAGDFLVKIIPQVDLIVIDSLVGLIPTGESERDTGEPQVALSARVNSLICRKIYGALGDRNVTFIFINQLREKVGTMYGNPYTTAGGHALKHMYNTRVEVKAGKPIEEKKEKIGKEMRFNCVKNKRGRPYRRTEADFYLTGSIDNNKSLFYAGIKMGVIERSGNTYSFGEKKAVGQEKFTLELDDKDWANIEKKIWELMK